MLRVSISHCTRCVVLTGAPWWIFGSHMPWKLKNLICMSLISFVLNMDGIGANVIFARRVWSWTLRTNDWLLLFPGWPEMPSLWYSWYTCHTGDRRILTIQTISVTEWPLNKPTRFHALFEPDSCRIAIYRLSEIHALTRCHMSTYVGLGISITARYSGTTYHYIYILISQDLCCRCKRGALLCTVVSLNWALVFPLMYLFDTVT